MAYKTLLFALAASLPLALAETFEVAVGPGGQLVFEPSTIEGAVAGDIINFSFHPNSHTATQSTFDSPCSPLAGGFASGTVNTEAEGEIEQQFTLPDDYDGTTPLWFYCGVGRHCQNGMVFAINAPPAPNDRSFEAFEAAARGGGASPSASNSTQAPGSSTSASAPRPTASGEPEEDQDGGAASSVGTGTGVVAALAGLVASVLAL